MEMRKYIKLLKTGCHNKQFQISRKTKIETEKILPKKLCQLKVGVINLY